MNTSEPMTSLRNERKPCHFWVDNEVADCYQPIVGADAIWVYCRIARNANGAWIVSPRLRGTSDTRVGLREMAEWCGKSADTVSRSLEVLELVGLITAEHGTRSKGRYALADVKDLVTREGGLYDREMGSFRLPDGRVDELKKQVRELRLKLARKKSGQLSVVGGKAEVAASVAESDSLDGGLFAVSEAKCDRTVALDVQNCRSSSTASITEELKTAKQNTPQPPQAGACDLDLPEELPFSEEQLAHLAKTSGMERKQWEHYYREQNRKAAEVAEEERAKAKRLEELKRLLPDEPSAVRWVMCECGFVSDGRKRGLESVIAAVIAQERSRGRPPWDAAPMMVAAWIDYTLAGELLAVQYGPVKFYRLGIWARRNSWRIDERKRERANAGVGGR